MTVTINDYMERLLEAYEKRMGVSKFKVITEMGISFARYYAYRNGYGNPTGKMLDRIHAFLYDACPGLAAEIILENLDEALFILVIRKMAESFSERDFRLFVEEYDKRHAITPSIHPEYDR